MNSKTLSIHNLGETIKTLRKEKGLSQDELAREANISAYYISKIERNVTNPSFLIIIRIFAALGYRVTIE